MSKKASPRSATDRNHISIFNMRQESDAHQSAQRVQTGIEEAVTIDKNGRDGSDTPLHPVGARAPAHRRTQGPSSMEKEHDDTHSSRKPKQRPQGQAIRWLIPSSTTSRRHDKFEVAPYRQRECYSAPARVASASREVLAVVLARSMSPVNNVPCLAPFSGPRQLQSNRT